MRPLAAHLAAAVAFAAIISCPASADPQNAGNNTASGWQSVAWGMDNTASGNLAVAFGFNVSAASNSSVAMGVNSQTVSDRNVPGGSSGGGAFAVGESATAIGDWSQAMGSQTTAHGYASNSLGEGTTSSTWGETALGLFTEASDLDDEEQRNASVIPVWKATDVVLRVGVGCQNSPKFPRRCDAAGSNGTRPKDALRVYKSGALYLANQNGSVIPDVQAELEKRASEIEALQQAVREMQDQIKLLQARGSGNAQQASEARSKIFNES